MPIAALVAILRAISYISLVRLVLDTATVVAAIRSDAGASRRLLRAAIERRRGITLLVSVPLLIEYEAVMTRIEHLKAARLSVADVGVLLDAVAAVAEPVRLAFLWRPVLADIDDDMVLETAVNGRADAIVTFNRRDFIAAAEQFGIPVWLPGEAVRRWENRS
jgi:putative PIN family toxin of toxin-antitoxin system